MTKEQILECLDEVGHRLLRLAPDTAAEHYKDLGLAFGVAYMAVVALSADDLESLAKDIDDLGLARGSKVVVN